MMLENRPNKRVIIAIILVFSVLSVLIDLKRAFGDYSSLGYISILFIGPWIKHRQIYFILAALGSVLIFLGMLLPQVAALNSERLIAVFLMWSAAFLLSLEIQRAVALEPVEKSLRQQLRDETEKYRDETKERAQAESETITARDEAHSLKSVNERLIARIGHELRTPLNNIRGCPR